MAKYEVKMACGHTETVELFGKTSERERKIEYFEKCGTCSCCYKEAKTEEMAAKFDVIEVKYADYKNNYSDCKTVADSYNKETKTIKIYVVKAAEEVVEEAIKEVEVTIEINGKEPIIAKAKAGVDIVDFICRNLTRNKLEDFEIIATEDKIHLKHKNSGQEVDVTYHVN